MRSKSNRLRWAGFLLLSLYPGISWSLEVNDQLWIDGFGTQGYLRTTENVFQNADSRGTFDFSAYNLMLKTNVTDRFAVWSELMTSSELADGIRLEWAFGEYAFKDSIRIKVGKMATPIGIYNETRLVYPVIPLSILPAFYSDMTEFSPETLKGAELSGRFSVGKLGAEYDLFGGGTYFDMKRTLPYNNLTGGRLWISSPNAMFRFGQTLFSGTAVSAGARTRMSTYIPSFELFTPFGLNLRGELALHYHQGEMKNPKDPRRLGYYVETTYQLTESLTPVVRYDVFYPRRRAVDFPKDYQQDLTFGFNYSFASYFVWKAEYHRIKGTTLLDPVFNPAPETRWNLMATSISFLF